MCAVQLAMDAMGTVTRAQVGCIRPLTWVRVLLADSWLKETVHTRNGAPASKMVGSMSRGSCGRPYCPTHLHTPNSRLGSVGWVHSSCHYCNFEGVACHDEEMGENHQRQAGVLMHTQKGSLLEPDTSHTPHHCCCCELTHADWRRWQR